jgi:LCP family protein required for cell wall assembly
VLIAVNLVIASSLVAAGSAYGYIRWRLDSIATVAAPHLTTVSGNSSEQRTQSADGLSPENILLIGNETRAGQVGFGDPTYYSGSLSDIIMIVHLDPATGKASLLSIPRDLFVPMPAGSPVGPYQKIDAALNDGVNGPDNLIAAITQDFGIPINHYIELKFDGAQAMVDALGGIKVDFPEQLYDATSRLRITATGCQLLNGVTALQLIRSRHVQYDAPGSPANPADWPADPQSDLSRIARDQLVMRILVKTAESEGFTNPLKLNSFLGALLSQVIIDPGLKSQLTKLATRFRHLNPSTAPELTLPVTLVGGPNGYSYYGAAIGDVDFAVQPADNATIAAWDSGSLPTPTAPTAVHVENLAGTYNLATDTAAGLAADGLPATATVDASVPASVTETLVNYPPGGLAGALDVEAHLQGAVVLRLDPKVPAGTVTVEAGSVLTVAPPAASATPSQTVGTQPTTSSPSATTTPPQTVPTPGGQTPSPSTAYMADWEPRACT